MQDENQPGQTPPQPVTPPPVEPTLPDTPLYQAEPQFAPVEPEISRKRAILRTLLGVGELIAGALVLALFFSHFIFHSYQVYGESMSPTLHEGDRLIISKVGRSWSSLVRKQYVPKRGDIIVFKSPQRDEIQLIKRVIGLPGERVIVKQGRITVYNQENPQGFNPDETFKADLPESTTGNVDIQLREGEIFVSGDNRVPGGSLDSRNDLGSVPVDNIIGELVIRLYPADKLDTF